MFDTLDDSNNTIRIIKSMAKVANFYTTQVLTGHGSFANYLRRFNLSEDSLCPICGQEDSAFHSLFECSDTNLRFLETIQHIGLDKNNLRHFLKKVTKSSDSINEFTRLCTGLIQGKITAFRNRLNRAAMSPDDRPPWSKRTSEANLRLLVEFLNNSNHIFIKRSKPSCLWQFSDYGNSENLRDTFDLLKVSVSLNSTSKAIHSLQLFNPYT